MQSQNADIILSWTNSTRNVYCLLKIFTGKNDNQATKLDFTFLMRTFPFLKNEKQRQKSTWFSTLSNT